MGQIVDFLPQRSVPDHAKCIEYLETGMGHRCGRSAMMAVRMNGDERFMCYHHVSLHYNELHHNPRTRKIQVDKADKRTPTPA